MKRISSFFTSLLRYFQKINFTTIFRKIKLSENVCKGNLYGRIHYYWEIHSFYKSSTISRPIFKKSILPQFSSNRSFRKFWTKETCINGIRILFLVTKRLDGNSSLWINRQDVFYAWNIIYSKRLFSRVWNPMIGARRSAIGGDTGIKGGKAGHLAPISLNRIFNPVPLSAVCRVVYCLTCTRPDCTIRGTLMHDKLAIYLPVHGFTCTRAPRNHLPATMELSYLDRSRGWLAWIDVAERSLSLSLSLTCPLANSSSTRRNNKSGGKNFN